MFAKSIVLSDAFLDMPMSARCLYFTLGMLADDDGFVNSPKSIMRQCGACEDDLKILFGKCFLIPFDSGIVVIKHWRINNYLRNDRYQQTNYRDEKNQLMIEENGAYQKIKGKVVKEAPKEIEQVEQKKEPVEEKSPVETAIEVYKTNYESLYKDGVLVMEKPVINNTCRKVISDAIKNYGIENVLQAIHKSYESEFCIKKGYCITTILSAGVISALINCEDKKERAAKETKKKKLSFIPVCKRCGTTMSDIDGTGNSYFCNKCRVTWKFKKGEWIEDSG